MRNIELMWCQIKTVLYCIILFIMHRRTTQYEIDTIQVRYQFSDFDAQHYLAKQRRLVYGSFLFFSLTQPKNYVILSEALFKLKKRSSSSPLMYPTPQRIPKHFHSQINISQHQEPNFPTSTTTSPPAPTTTVLSRRCLFYFCSVIFLVRKIRHFYTKTPCPENSGSATACNPISSDHHPQNPILLVFVHNYPSLLPTQPTYFPLPLSSSLSHLFHTQNIEPSHSSLPKFENSAGFSISILSLSLSLLTVGRRLPNSHKIRLDS